jgi:hypothetical protein
MSLFRWWSPGQQVGGLGFGFLASFTLTRSTPLVEVGMKTLIAGTLFASALLPDLTRII